MSVQSPPRPVVLCILDGWGEIPNGVANAVRLARKPNWQRFLEAGPVGSLEASGLNVGLPTGQMGNSEVGHMNIGAGRVLMQDLPRIDRAVEDGSMGKMSALLALIDALKKSGGTAHVMGLLSPGGVHSHQRHMAAVVKAIADAGVTVTVHAFLDGRDTPPRSAQGFIDAFQNDLKDTKRWSFGTVSGRYYAMDRDNRWDRVEKAYAALTCGEGETAATATEAVTKSYAADKGDEFVKPTIVGNYGGMRDGDGLVMINFRADRAREVLAALVDKAFSGFDRKKVVNFGAVLGMVEYSTELSKLIGAIFAPELPTDTLGEVISRAGLHQLRIAETEKYPHVTYFFNGGDEKVFSGEDRVLVPSPRVATYDLQPEMSAEEVTDKLVAGIGSGKYDLVVINYANADMVGHTGLLGPAIKAIEAVDACLGRLSAIVERAGGTLMITADHGNAEQMVDPVTGEPHTAHTTNPVPLILVNAPEWVAGLENGELADIAPTVLQLMGIEQPKAMTGHTLIRARSAEANQQRASA